MPEKTSKVILITGCSSGFGMLTAVRLARAGHLVIASMRNLEKRYDLLNEANRHNVNVDIQPLDVTDRDEVVKICMYISEEYGHLDALVNNAGYALAGAFEDLTDREIREQFDTNFFGALNVTRECIPLMRNRQGSKIINVSSVAGFSSNPCLGAYAATKHAMEAWGESLRYELKFFGIDVHHVEPGSYKTKIFAENGRLARNFDNEDSPYYEMNQHLRKLVDSRLADNHKDPEEVAELITKLIDKGGKFRNIPDIESKFQRAARKLLPYELYAWIVSKAFFKNFPVKAKKTA